MSKNFPNSYPKNPSYLPPMAPSAPQAHAGNPGYPPPPYNYNYSAGVPAPAQPYPMAQPNMMVTGPGYAPPQYYAPQAGYAPPANPGYPMQQGFNYAQPVGQGVAMAHFDAGARFDGIASQNIPPAPPGCAPNAAQMAAAQGGPVVGTQKKSNWLTGGSGGGMSFW